MLSSMEASAIHGGWLSSSPHLFVIPVLALNPRELLSLSPLDVAETSASG